MLTSSGSSHVRSLRGLIPSPKTVGVRRRGRSRPATCRAMGPCAFSCSTARDSCALFANVRESGASSSCPVGGFGWDVVRWNVTNLNRVDPLLGQDVRDDHNLVPGLKLFTVLQDPERRLQSLFRVRTEIDLKRKDTAIEHHG